MHLRLTNLWPSEFPIKLEFGSVGFVEGGKPEAQRKTIRARTRTNILNPYTTQGSGIEPGSRWWEARAPATASKTKLKCYLYLKLTTKFWKLPFEALKTIVIHRKWTDNFKTICENIRHWGTSFVMLLIAETIQLHWKEMKIVSVTNDPLRCN